MGSSNEQWYFTKERLSNTPSRKCGLDADKELAQRQQAANFIQDMGQRLQVTQLCINTAIVYMHRFYVFHSFTHFHRNALSTAALFLAAKVEEQPRKLEHIIKVAYLCLQKSLNPSERKPADSYIEQAQDLIMNENMLLQTLGFDVAIDHPHTYVVKCCHLVGASKDLSQTSYFMASNSLHLTTMCLQYKPTVVACFCIHLACKWSNWEIPVSSEGKPWFLYVDNSVTQELLEQLTEEFLLIFDKCPSRLKKRIMLLSSNNQNSTTLTNYPFDSDCRKLNAIHQKKQDEEGGPSTSNDAKPDFKRVSASAPFIPNNVSHSIKQAPAAGSSISSVGNSAPSHNATSNVIHNSTSSTVSNIFPPVIKCSTNVTTPNTVITTAVPSTYTPHSTNKITNTVPQKINSITNIPQLKPKSVSSNNTENSIISNNYNNNNNNNSNSSNNNHNSSNGSVNVNCANTRPHVTKDVTELRSKPAAIMKPGPISPVTTNQIRNKKDKPSLLDTRFASSSHPDIISNVVKEVALAKQNEKLSVKTKKEKDHKNNENVSLLLPSQAQLGKTHSIFSPPPVVENDDDFLIPQNELAPNDNMSPIKQRDKITANRNHSLNHDITSVVSLSDKAELIPVIKRLELNGDEFNHYNINANNTNNSNAVSPVLQEEMISENITCTLDQLIASSQINSNDLTDSLNYSHKKKKKHKEKDKHRDQEKKHKDKKKHKEDKHHHHHHHHYHKEKETLKELEPIKITIPKEKLIDIPMKLKIKINKDQFTASSSSSSSTINDIKLKFNKDSYRKHRKRGHDHPGEEDSEMGLAKRSTYYLTSE